MKAKNVKHKADSKNGAEPVMLPEEARGFLHIQMGTFYRLANRGMIPGAFKIGRSWRVVRRVFLASIGAEKGSAAQ